MGQEISSHRAKLATKLGAYHPIFCLSRCGAADHLHDECHRGLERKAAPRRKNERPFSDRRGRDEIVVSRLAPGRGKMENAATRMVRGEDPIRHHVRRKVRHGVMVNPASHTKFQTDPSIPDYPTVRSLTPTR
jgi:hypothetical protein